MSNQLSTSPHLIIALDYADPDAALAFLDHCSAKQCRIKIGNELFTRAGIDFVKTVQARGFEIFLDLKYHDIPNTVAASVKSAADLGVWMINVHCLGGAAMLTAASDALATLSVKPLLIGVSILTSHTQASLAQLGLTDTIEAHVLQFAKMAHAAGLDGLVCSAEEAPLLRSVCGDDFILVCPGIRLADSPVDDQRRIVTPAQAIKNGADYIVIGRPITRSHNPSAVIRNILNQM